MKSKSGFTIIEILTVIVIISVLATIMSLSYQKIQTQSRDSKRANDATVFISAIEGYYDRNGEYPVGCASNITCVSSEPTYSISGTAPQIGSTTTKSQLLSFLGEKIRDLGDPNSSNRNDLTYTPFYTGTLAGERTRFDRYVYFGGAASPTTSGTPTAGAAYQSDASFKCTMYFQNLTPANSNKVSSYIFAYYSENETKWIIHLGKNCVPPYLNCLSGTARLDTDPAS